MTAAVSYRLDLADRNAHVVRVEARFPTAGLATGATLDLKLPVWTPGSYLVREFERHVQDLSCAAPDGRALAVRKIDKSTWRIDSDGEKEVVVRYGIYANDLTVRSAHVDDSHAFLNGACVFLYADALRNSPARVTVVPPEGWHVDVALPLEKGAYAARSYDELVDSPFEIGTHRRIDFVAQKRPHRFCVWGKLAVAEDVLKQDVIAIIDAAAALFGDVPYDDYLFILMLTPNQYGGLEHSKSCALLSSPFTFHPRKKYEEFLELVSHEFFHLWNVKRIHPEVLGPFDYQREAYTRCLWVMEGITSYYDRHLLVRAKIQKPEKYLEKIAEELGKIATIPGRKKQSLEESSFDAWIKLYRPDENSINSTISYYLKGGIVALLLDLEIRYQTQEKKSLDDGMRLLWTRFGKVGRGFPDDAVQALMEEATGARLGAFFDHHVRGREEMDAARLLRTVGLTLDAAAPDDDDAQAWLGATTREDGDSLIVANVLDGSPAMQAGLSAGDELLALDGLRVDDAGLKARLAARKPGDSVELHIFRRDELRAVRVTLGTRPIEKFAIAPAADATDAQKKAYESWMGEPFPTGESED
jgi:predicted metalloprotease with PDZ domain